MEKLTIILFSAVIVSLFSVTLQIKYEPNWASLDNRPLPPWYDEAKFGIFLHWGVFSVPSTGGTQLAEWFWYLWKTAKNPYFVRFMEQNYKPSFTYTDFAEQFTAEFFDPDQWADIFNGSGAQYVVLTSKHHEGFTNWPSKMSFNWNSMAVGPKRDLVGDLANSIRKRTKIHFGLYHSMFEWFNPLYIRDKANNFQTQDYVRRKTMPELYEIVNTYKPELIWSDGEWDASDVYWNSTNFLAWLYNESPVKDIVVVNDRWGNNTRSRHGGYYNGDDRFHPSTLQKHKWENAMTLDKTSWGYRREATIDNLYSIEDLLSLLLSTVSCGGNLLMNIGPTKSGIIVPIFQERLRQMGEWLSVNGNAIYGTKPWAHQNDTVTTNIWYTSKMMANETVVFATVLVWPGETLALGAVKTSTMTKVMMLGLTDPVQWTVSPSGSLEIKVPQLPFNKMPCKWAWVFQLNGVSSA